MRKWINLFESHLEYIGNCTNPHMADGLEDMMDNAKQVSYRTLLAAVGRETLAQTFPDFDWSGRGRDLAMKDDYAVSYFRSTFKGQPCYYVRESGIEHVFIDPAAQVDAAKGEALAISRDGEMRPVSNDGSVIFTVRLLGDGKAEISQSIAANTASARTLIGWLADNAITTVVEDGDEQPVDDVVDWLEGIDGHR